MDRTILDIDSSRCTTLSATMVDLSSSGVKPENVPASASANLRGSRDNRAVGGRSRNSRIGSSTISTNTNTTSDAESNIAVESGRRNAVPSDDPTADQVTSVELGKALNDEADENNDALPGEFLNKRPSGQGTWRDGPGDNADSEQVGKT